MVATTHGYTEYHHGRTAKNHANVPTTSSYLIETIIEMCCLPDPGRGFERGRPPFSEVALALRLRGLVLQ
jgi:hypothetical protein